MEKSKSLEKKQESSAVRITAEDIHKYFCPLATEKEVFMALGVINSLQLNPHKKEVYLIKYDQSHPISIVVGYDVYIKRAERSGKLDGWEVGITDDEEKAWIKIYRKDWKIPFYWEVKLSEFNKNQSTWKQIPSFMGKKVVIGQGFRLAFADECGGLPYTREEIETYGIETTPAKIKPDIEIPQELPAPEVQTVPESKKKNGGNGNISTEPQQKAIHTLATKLYGKEQLKFYARLGTDYGVESTKKLTNLQASELISQLSKELDSDGK